MWMDPGHLVKKFSINVIMDMSTVLDPKHLNACMMEARHTGQSHLCNALVISIYRLEQYLESKFLTIMKNISI